MKERPILFSGQMVRAILDDRKTLTRRLIPTNHGFAEVRGHTFDPGNPHHVEWMLRWGPYGQAGDRLWVRETWAGDDLCGFVYRADHPDADLSRGDLDDGEQSIRRWRPAIHMPRAASRISLDVSAVRVERLCDITEEDARAEGASVARVPEPPPVHLADFYRSAYKALWDHLNGKRDPWENNPWVWVVSFTRMATARATPGEAACTGSTS